MRLILIMLLLLTAPALASDGVLEINQTCAVETGCFSGDTAGFPVTISASGSYRLTGNLDLNAEGVNVSGVAVSAPAVTIDLGGFQIVGPTSCSGSGAGINCSPSSTGVGSAGVRFTIDATAGAVQNGIVRNMTNFGIFSQATGLRVRDITAIHNGRDGIAGREGSLVVNSVAIENGQDGIDINTGSVADSVTAIGNGSNGIRGQGTSSLVTRTSVRNNGMHGFSLGIGYKFGRDNVSSGNDLASVCGGGICTDRRRIYITQEYYDGSEALTACRLGFHMASLPEMIDVGRFDYDYVLGRTERDSGKGAPAINRGWARTGFIESLQSCDGWTSNLATNRGHTVVFGLGTEEPTPLGDSHVLSPLSCSQRAGVWCLESLPQ